MRRWSGKVVNSFANHSPKRLERRFSKTSSTQVFTAEYLRTYVIKVFKSLHVPTEDAELAADVLLESDIRGIESHGVARLKTYVELFKAGLMEPNPKITIVRETPSTATVDGGNGLGLVVGPKANQIAIDKATNVGSGWVSVCNSNHFGIAGYYALKSMDKSCIGWAMTNTTPLVVPLGSSEKYLGTNPIAVSFPGNKEQGIVIDMATSAVAWGKIEIAKRKQKKIPLGWGVDKDGKSTTDPNEVVMGGALQPVGVDRKRGIHKGYCLSMMVDILCGVLPGANWGPFVPPFTLEIPPTEKSGKKGKGIGHFFGAMRIDGFSDPDEFRSKIDDYCAEFRNSPGVSWGAESSSKDEIGGSDWEGTGALIPGDPEWRAAETRKVKGIPLLSPVVEDLRQISNTTGIPF